MTLNPQHPQICHEYYDLEWLRIVKNNIAGARQRRSKFTPGSGLPLSCPY
jgi:hypothetical protein